jgi:hypothetical protein
VGLGVRLDVVHIHALLDDGMRAPVLRFRKYNVRLQISCARPFAVLSQPTMILVVPQLSLRISRGFPFVHC